MKTPSTLHVIQTITMDPSHRPTPAQVDQIARAFGVSAAQVESVIDRHQQPAAQSQEARSAVIYDDTAAAVPMDEAGGYDLATCDQKHQRMSAYQAQRIDALEVRLAALEATIRDWSAGR